MAGLPLDILLDDDMDIVVTDDLQIVSGILGIAQCLKIALSIFLGEWFLDESIGIDYWNQVLVKDPNIPAIREMFSQEILKAPGIRSIISLDITLESSDRSATITYTVKSDEGLITDSVTQGVPA